MCTFGALIYFYFSCFSLVDVYFFIHFLVSRVYWSILISLSMSTCDYYYFYRYLVLVFFFSFFVTIGEGCKPFFKM